MANAPTVFRDTSAPAAIKVPAEKHVAVSPFTNVGNDPANETLCDGLIETLSSQLSALNAEQGSLWVVPASEVRRRNLSSSAIFVPHSA